MVTGNRVVILVKRVVKEGKGSSGLVVVAYAGGGVPAGKHR